MSLRLLYMRRRRVRSEKRGKNNLPQIGGTLIGTAIVGVVGFFVIVALGIIASAFSAYTAYASEMPDANAITLNTSQQFKTTQIYDRSGSVLLYELIDPRGGDRTYVPLSRVPPDMVNATIALEDKSFWTNEGVDYLGMGRAVYNMLRGQPLQGASTLTQQLVKKVLIPQRECMDSQNKPIPNCDPLASRTNIESKIKETIWARELTNKFSKQQILEWYLNTVYYGNLAYGVEAASQAYFGKHVQDLTLSEAATLAAIPEYPALNPVDNPDEAQSRRDITLDLMVNQGQISEQQAAKAKTEKPVVVQKKFDIKAPHFVFYVRKYLEDKYGPDAVNRGGWKVLTSLDYGVQQTAEEIARNQIAKLTQEKRNVTDASVVVIRPTTGEILGMVGSVDYFNQAIHGQVNIATSDRQPGSSFKVFNYLTAFSQGYSPATVVYDVRTSFEDLPNPPYVPENYDRKYHGPVRFRIALGSSYNIPAVKVLSLVGVRNALDTAHRMGITTLNAEHYGLALTLGGGEVKLLDMTYAYSVLGNGGVMAGEPVPEADQKPGYRTLDPIAVLKIVDSNGNTIEDNTKPKTNSIVSPQLAYEMTDVLSDNNARAPAFGINNVLKLTRPAAVKTGTTSSWKDNWTIGYTPDYAVGVWVGNADNKEMEHISGVTGAGPIWHDVMEQIHQNVPVHPFVEPPGMAHVDVCATSGLLPTAQCPQVVKELFIKGNEPKQRDNIWQAFRIFKPNGKLATAFDPPDQVQTVVFPVYPPEAEDWVRENKVPQPPTDFDTTFAASTSGGDVAILSPSAYSYVHGPVTITGNAKIPDLREWRVAVGTGLDPTQWLNVGNGTSAVDNNNLATWNITDNGLYTIQLTAIDGSGTPHTATEQVTVDNKAPTVDLVNPWDDKQYLMEDDEWVSIDADAHDNLSMGHVDFFVDNNIVGTSQVAPFSLKWNITMNDALSVTLRTAGAISYSYTISDDQGKPVTNTVSAPVSRKGGRAIVNFPNGMSAILDSGGYTETHTVKVKAYDAAGNSTESKPVRFLVSHRPPPSHLAELGLAWSRFPDLRLPFVDALWRWLREEPGVLHVII